MHNSLSSKRGSFSLISLSSLEPSGLVHTGYVTRRCTSQWVLQGKRPELRQCAPGCHVTLDASCAASLDTSIGLRRFNDGASFDLTRTLYYTLEASSVWQHASSVTQASPSFSLLTVPLESNPILPSQHKTLKTSIPATPYNSFCVASFSFREERWEFGMKQRGRTPPNFALLILEPLPTSLSPQTTTSFLILPLHHFAIQYMCSPFLWESSQHFQSL